MVAAVSGGSLFTYGLEEWAREPLAAFDAFLANFKFDGRSLRESSFVIYRGMFERLVQWAVEEKRPLMELRELDLELFLESRGLAPETRHRYLLVFSSLFNHLARLRGELPVDAVVDNPARALLLEAPAPEREEPEWLDRADMARFIKALPPATTWKKSRSNALAYLILGAGLRVSEALGLALGDLVQKNGALESLWVQARRPRPQRQVPIHGFARAPLEAWLQQRAAQGIAGNLVFPSSPAGAALQPVTLFRLVQNTLDAAGIHKRYEGATLLRNTCGALWLEQHDSGKVMQWMGHATLRTTELLMPEDKRTKDTATG